MACSPARSLPYLRALATSYEAIGDYESAQRALRQGLRVHGMGLGELDSVALRDSMAYFERARQLFISPRTEKDVELFFEALQDNRAMVEAQFERNTADYATLEAVGFSQLSNYYLLLGTDLSLASSQDAGNATLDLHAPQSGLHLLQRRGNSPVPDCKGR
jgi:tetratricopeptide (TPR) repeat protein